MFTEKDIEMKSYEVFKNTTPPDGSFIVVRLDGVGFSKFTQQLSLMKPFDKVFDDIMNESVLNILESVPDIVGAYRESDEISLLVKPNSTWFNLRVEKLLSVLAGQMTSFVTLAFKRQAVFDARIIALPSEQKVVEYFQWRVSDSYKNALNGYAYWLQRNAGLNERPATTALLGKSREFKKALIAEYGVDWASVPEWQKYGWFFHKEAYLKDGFNPVTQETTQSVRTKIVQIPCHYGALPTLINHLLRFGQIGLSTQVEIK